MKEEQKEMSPRVAKLILQIKDSVIRDDMEDVYHYLYQIASPDYDKLFDDVWSEIEEIAK